jgi:exopolysaccharide production protein ExoQ
LGAAALRERLTFWAAVGVVLIYSQFWVMQITGPVVTVDPNVSASLRNYFLPAYAITLLLAGLQIRSLAVGMLRSPLLPLLVALTFVSVTWSIDPEVTVRRAMAVLLTTLSGMVIATRFDWPRFVEVLASAFAILVAMSFATVLLVPSYGIMTTDFPGAWRGVWDHKNALGYDMTVGFVVFVAAAMLSPRRKRLWGALALAAMALVFLSTSKTSLVSCLAAVFLVGVIWIGRRGPAGVVLASYILVSGLFAAGFLVVADPGLLLQALGKDETLTGRTRIWAAVMHQIEKRPWTGYGYGAVWTETSNWGPLPWISKEQGFVIHEAHNGWLAVWLELGLIGLAAAAFTIAEVWTRAVFGLFRRPSTYLTLPFLAIFSLHSITEAALLSQNDFIWLIFSAIALKVASPEQPSPWAGHGGAAPIRVISTRSRRRRRRR